MKYVLLQNENDKLDLRFLNWSLIGFTTKTYKLMPNYLNSYL